MAAAQNISHLLARAYDQLKLPAVIADSRMSIVYANTMFRNIFNLGDRNSGSSLSELFGNEQQNMPVLTMFELFIAAEEQKKTGEFYLLYNNISWLCSAAILDDPEEKYIAVNEVVYYYDFAACQYLYLSKNSEQVLGFTKDEINAIGFNKIIKKHDRVLPFSLPQEQSSPPHPQIGSTLGNEYQLRMKDGSLRWFEERAAKIKDASGKNTGQFGTLRDCTSEKENFISMRDARTNLQNLLNHTPVGLGVIQNGKLVYVNQEMLWLFKATSETEVIGKSIYRFIPRDQLDAVKELELEVLKNNEPLYEFELDLFTLGRTKISVTGSMIPIKYLGKPAQQITFRDISRIGKAKMLRRSILKILQAADEINDLKEFFKVIHETIAASITMNNFYIALLDKTTKVLTFPYGVDEFDTFEDSPLNEKSLTNLVLNSGQSMLVTREEDERLRKLGKVDLIGEPAAIWLGIPLKIQNETIGVMVVQDYKTQETYTQREKEVLETISYSIAHAIERKRREAERLELIDKLREINASKDAFFSIISHDLRSPFTSIMGFINILLTDYKDMEDDEVLDLLNSLNTVSGNVLNMVVNLLEFSRFQLGRMEFAPKMINLRAIVENVTGMLQGNLNKKQIKLFNNVPEEQQVFADDKMLLSVMQNLIANAIKFTFDGGSIFVSVENESDGYLPINVRDEGIGMSPGQIDNLFKLEKIHSSLGTRSEHGTGLGLILVKDFIKKHNGSVTVSSEVGKGTTFKITLPVQASS
ncbi:MAG: PAS domain S-box protein [Ignavibacteriales bacterium]|nr:PAS domain S-box protein [Ignavibacteriales bacterium]